MVIMIIIITIIIIIMPESEQQKRGVFPCAVVIQVVYESRKMLIS